MRLKYDPLIQTHYMLTSLKGFGYLFRGVTVVNVCDYGGVMGEQCLALEAAEMRICLMSVF